ncbi:hypothetical protein [Thauera linaloolentis]|uniref:hypothetical protein n=1 Tax=Thauera linaloolentis TaxID=76112 RepID=UPI0012FC4B55|nr:hypothetical protein [Thauera linaloolentis]MCM8566846.1 hypothetical protein [Thauera linaloolentis]
MKTHELLAGGPSVPRRPPHHQPTEHGTRHAADQAGAERHGLIREIAKRGADAETDEGKPGHPAAASLGLRLVEALAAGFLVGTKARFENGSDHRLCLCLVHWHTWTEKNSKCVIKGCCCLMKK